MRVFFPASAPSRQQETWRKLPVATLSVVLLTSSLFYWWSGGFLSSPQIGIPQQYGLALRSPLTYLTYPFVHLWPLHLFANMAFVLVFGSTIEREVGAKKFVLFYMFSAAIVGVVSQATDLFLSNPAATIVGASGVAFALVGASLVLKPVRTLALFMLLSYLAIPFFLSAGISQEQERATGEAMLQINLIEQNKSELSTRLGRGEITPEEFNRTLFAMEARRQQEAGRISGIEQAKSREATPPADTAHASAPFAGALLMLVFRPSSLGEWAVRERWIEEKLRRAQKSIYKEKRNPTV